VDLAGEVIMDMVGMAITVVSVIILLIRTVEEVIITIA
jgi:hypothetical protein